MKHLLLTTIAAVLVVGCGPSIHDVVLDGNIEAVKQHIADGTDVNAKNKYGRTPLHRAASLGRREIAGLLIANGADVNANSYGWTPLHNAASWGRKEIVELLIAGGADVNAKDNAGTTPLDWAIKQIFQTRHSPAVQQRHTETAALLRKHGGKTGEELKAEGK